jgi:hypothetical protein
LHTGWPLSATVATAQIYEGLFVLLLAQDRKKQRRKFTFEPLEPRQMMTASTLPAGITTGLNWLQANVKNVALRNLAKSEFQGDGLFSRTDMIALFRQVEKDGVVGSLELSGMRAIVNHTAFFSGLEYVRQLSADVVGSNAANANYLGAKLGNLAAGNAASKMEKLLDKWFFGTDHPVAKSDWVGSNGQNLTFTYQTVAGQLFVQQAGDTSAVAYTDIVQGGIGDCYFLSSLAETALKDPSAITNMFIVNGDGTYTVKFMNGSYAQYVTVDSKLPTSSGTLVFAGMGEQASNPNNELWVALAEKAYVQMNEGGWIRPASWGGGKNVYNAISGGCMFMALGQITGDATAYGYSTIYSTQGFNMLAQAVAAGDLVCLGSKANPDNSQMASNSQIVGDHAYAVLSVDTAHQTVTVYNPWGLNNGHDVGVITLSWYQVSQTFDYYDRTA